MEFYGLWHDLTANPNDVPERTAWYAIKIKASNDLKMVYGYENISSKTADGWVEIQCPL